MERDPWLEDFTCATGRIGVFGGSFDPVHRAHLEVARSARAAHELERVVFLPTARNPLKPKGPRASDADRLAMLRLALRSESGLYVSPFEIRRGGTSYTVETLAALRATLGVATELFFVAGSDCLPQFPRWYRVRELFALARICIVEREGFAREDLDTLEADLGAELVAKLRRDFVSRVPIPGSSTASRQALEEARELESDVPAVVLEYIRAHGLYR